MQVTIEYLNWRGEGVGGGQTFRNVLAGETVDAVLAVEVLQYCCSPESDCFDGGPGNVNRSGVWRTTDFHPG